MARQTGIIQISGKVGNVVGMKNGYGTKANAFLREHVTDIKNPQTDSQLDQRAKMLPAVLFRRQLESLISRAWEGKKYGGQSSREFMKYALREPWSRVPQLEKDSTLPVPGEYLISKGSLPSIGYSMEEGTSSDLIMTTLSTGSTQIGSGSTIGQLSEALVENNAGIRAGDQITFLRADADGEIINYIVYSVSSFIVDPNSEDLIDDIIDVTRFPLMSQSSSQSSDAVVMFYRAHNPNFLLGFAAVVSREGTNTAQRSTQRFAVKKTSIPDYFADELTPQIADTYRSSSSRANLDWPYEEGETGTNTPKVTVQLQQQPDNAGTVTGAGTYEKGTSVTVTATATGELSFSGWYDEDNTRVGTARTYTFVALRNIVLTARWEERP